MVYATKKALNNAKRKAWRMEVPGAKYPPPNPYAPHSYVPVVDSSAGNAGPPVEIGGGLGISAKRFPNIKGADLFYP